jgi:hypothetical protein
MLAFFAGSVIVVLAYPGLPKSLARLHYRWAVTIIAAFSALVAGVALTRLPLLSLEQAAGLSDYVAIVGTGLFAATNLLAIASTSRQHPRP